VPSATASQMKAHLIPVLFGIVLLLASCGGAPDGRGTVWAEVNGQPILQSRVEEIFERQVRALPEAPATEEALARKLNILSELIQQEILWQKAVRAGVRVTDADVEERLEDLHGTLSQEQFEASLRAEGFTTEKLKEKLRRQLSIEKLLEQSLSASLEVSEQEIADYYASHQESFRFIETQFHVAAILVTPRGERQVRNLRNNDARSDSQAQRKVQFLLQRLRAGDDFAELARNFSEDPITALAGGDLGFFPESALAQAHPALRRAVERLQVGQFAGPVRTQDGYVVIKLLEREAPGQRELTDPQVQKAIREQLTHQKRRLLEAAYLEQAVREARVANYLARQVLESYGAVP
ncbi:MAG: peptidylprolyl isomerase, partial [Terriglobia bacterium]